MKKTTGKITAVITLVLSIAIFIFTGIFDGETKAVERYFDAIDRQDQTAFDKYSEKKINVDSIRSDYIRKSGLEDSDDIDFKVEFPSGATIKQGGDNFAVPIKLTIYDDKEHYIFEATANVTYIGKKWRVFSVTHTVDTQRETGE
ncbi:MAG: hypothetical protein LBL80_01800 [Ruminococcus sp.]|jgi:hypothetical protein|nr:hypothetical protein [Ruminococcus sp.]